MTGPEHYREAEELLAHASNADSDANPADVQLLLQFALVHATLAQAAATGLAADADGMHIADTRAWTEAAGVTP